MTEEPVLSLSKGAFGHNGGFTHDKSESDCPAAKASTNILSDPAKYDIFLINSVLFAFRA